MKLSPGQTMLLGHKTNINHFEKIEITSSITCHFLTTVVWNYNRNQWQKGENNRKRWNRKQTIKEIHKCVEIKQHTPEQTVSHWRNQKDNFKFLETKMKTLYQNLVVLVQPCSRVWLCDPMNGGTPGFPVLHCLPEFAQAHVHWVRMPSSHVILCCPLLLPLSVFPRIGVCSNESALCIRWPEFSSFSISACKEYSWLIFRIDWFDLAAHGTLNSLLQHYSSKPSVLRHLASFMVQLSHPYVTTGRTTALTRWTFCWQGDVSAF